MAGARTITIIGAGHVAEAVVAGIPPSWDVVLVDVSETALTSFPERPSGALTRVQGDGTSRLVLARCGLGRAAVIVAATRSDEVNKEVARVAREAFGVEERVVLLDVPEGLEAAGLLRSEVVARHLATAARCLNMLPLGEARATTLGLGAGELLQVTVLEGSPAVGRELRSLVARDWLVAAVYRGSELIVPHGDTAAQPGDRVLLVGEPSELRLIAAWFRGGDPTFPTLYGANIGWVGEVAAPLARWLGERTPATAAVELPAALLDPDELPPEEAARRLREREIGCVVMPPAPVPWAARLGLVRPVRADLLFGLGLPLLVSRGAPPFTRLLLALGPQQDPRPLGNVAIDLARELGATLTCLTVLPPRIAGGEISSDLSGPRQLARLASLHDVPLELIQSEGNPIERIRHHARGFDLVVVGHGLTPRRSTVFSPDISLFLLHDMPVSTLLVPRADG